VTVSYESPARRLVTPLPPVLHPRRGGLRHVLAREARERIAAELRRPCRFLAYPYGEHDARVRAAARAAGYEAAFALRSSEWRPDRYALPRVDLYRRDGDLRARLKTIAGVRRPVRLLAGRR
jgi:peptidoglycan/xylan/chitin deacetylase (PgdA/CDA1 family)